LIAFGLSKRHCRKKRENCEAQKKNLLQGSRGGHFMKLIVTGKNMGVSDKVRDYLEEKVGKFEKYFRSNLEVHATFGHRDRQHKNVQIVEITIPMKLGGFFRVQEEDVTMEAAIDLAVEKLQKQIAKHKTKLEKRYKGHDTIRFENIPAFLVPEGAEAEEEKHEVIRTKRFAVKPMDAEEAILQMEMVGHNFYVFRNQETDELNVVYIRKDGKYGLIEPNL
jgi:putative sigma-54 modulation protein